MREEDLDKFISLFTTMKKDFQKADNNKINSDKKSQAVLK